MSLARTSPSLRTRILQQRYGLVTIPSGQSGITKPVKQSYSERYRGTEFATHVERPTVSEPPISRGRMLVLTASCAAAVTIGILLAAAPV